MTAMKQRQRRDTYETILEQLLKVVLCDTVTVVEQRQERETYKTIIITLYWILWDTVTPISDQGVQRVLGYKIYVTL